MKAIFVESQNGYLAKNAEDDMSWTPLLDKVLFKLLSIIAGNGIYICSKHTFMLLPKKMLQDPYRTFIVAEKTGLNSLKNLQKKYPEAVLIGGPRFLKAAYAEKIIDMFIVTTLTHTIKNNSKYENPFLSILLKADILAEAKFGDILTVRVYRNEYKY